MQYVTHLLVSRRGPAAECGTSRAKVAATFAEYHALVKAGGFDADNCCKRCHAAYLRRKAAVESARQ